MTEVKTEMKTEMKIETKPLVQGGKESVTESLETRKYIMNCFYSENDSAKCSGKNAFIASIK